MKIDKLYPVVAPEGVNKDIVLFNTEEAREQFCKSSSNWWEPICEEIAGRLLRSKLYRSYSYITYLHYVEQRKRMFYKHLY